MRGTSATFFFIYQGTSTPSGFPQVPCFYIFNEAGLYFNSGAPLIGVDARDIRHLLFYLSRHFHPFGVPASALFLYFQ